jgi:hypothetical protein
LTRTIGLDVRFQAASSANRMSSCDPLQTHGASN